LEKNGYSWGLEYELFNGAGAHKVNIGKETCRRKLDHGCVIFPAAVYKTGKSFGSKVAFSEKSRSSVEMNSQLRVTAIS